jgi:uracil-DNA glycosylase family 4
MSEATDELLDVVRQLRAELDWAARTGLVVEDAPIPELADEGPAEAAAPDGPARDGGEGRAPDRGPERRPAPGSERPAAARPGRDASPPAREPPRPAPGGWDSSRPAPAPSGGWDSSRPAPASGGGWDSSRPAPAPSGGWDSSRPAPAPSGGWESSRPAPASPGPRDPPRPAAGGGWDPSRPAAASARGPAPRRPEPPPPRAEPPWADDEPPPPDAPPGGWEDTEAYGPRGEPLGGPAPARGRTAPEPRDTPRGRGPGPAPAERPPVPSGPRAWDAVAVGWGPPPGPFRANLAVVRETLGDCQRCKLAPTRGHIVFGVGDPNAELMFIGEGPGADEDKSGEPFVGAAGQLLTRMIAAMGLTRSEVYIANIVKCRPPGNRDPQPDEIAACLPFLRGQIAAIRPKVIVALGKPATLTLLGLSEGAISRLRGRWHDFDGIPLMPTFHPSYVLRSSDGKRPVWEDLQAVLEKLGRPLPGAAGGRGGTRR